MEGIEEASKWRLQSGRFVEDVVFDAYKTKTMAYLNQSPVGSWILDLRDKQILNLFDADEQAQIRRESMIPLPPLSEDWAIILDRLARIKQVDDVAQQSVQLVRQMDTIELGEELWLGSALSKWTMLWMNNQFSEARSEVWWTVNLWAPIFDSLLQLIPGVVFER